MASNLKASNAEISPTLLDAFRKACDAAGREQAEVFREYLGDILRRRKRGERLKWPAEETTGHARFMYRLEAPMKLDLSDAVAATRIRIVAWVHLAVWTAVQAGAKPIRKERAA